MIQIEKPTCSICRKVVDTHDNQVLCVTCLSTFCKSHLAVWLKKSNLCPVCREIFPSTVNSQPQQKHLSTYLSIASEKKWARDSFTTAMWNLTRVKYQSSSDQITAVFHLVNPIIAKNDLRNEPWKSQFESVLREIMLDDLSSGVQIKFESRYRYDGEQYIHSEIITIGETQKVLKSVKLLIDAIALDVYLFPRS